MSSNFNMHTIKRAARKEAWYGDSYNPFRKTMRSNTFGGQSSKDLEAGRGVDDGSQLSEVRTEPLHYGSRQLEQPAQIRPSKEEEHRIEKANEPTSSRPSDPESDTAILEKRSTRHPSQEEKARRRFISTKFFKHGKAEELAQEGDDVEKKRPWYKGKILPHKQPFTIKNQLQATIFNSWINILLIAAPAGIALNYAGVDKKAVFAVNFIAIIPLAGLLSFATEEIALHVGESLGGLLNASFGNAVEMIVSIIALTQDKIVIVQTSLIGSILSNLLLVMGMCFFFGGLRRSEQFFNQTVAQTAASMLALAIGSIIIPTCFDQFSSTDTTKAPVNKVAPLSRGTSVILLVVYGAYLFFQLKTHTDMFNIESQKVAARPRKHALPEGAIGKALAKTGGVVAGPGRAQMEERPPKDELINTRAHEEADEEPEEPTLHIAVAWATLAGATAIIGLCAEFMVDGIDAIVNGTAISEEFVGLILLPIVGNAAEHATAVTVAIKDKMDLAIGVAVGSSMQVSLLLIPLMVVIGWIMGKDDMNLSFDGFQVTVLFVAILLVNYLIADGKSHWLEGQLLMCLYLIIAVCAFYYPQKNANGTVVGT